MDWLGFLEDDGCSFFPDGSWLACCSAHDDAFAYGTELHQFFAANWDLFRCVAQHDPIAAAIMFIGVSSPIALALFIWGRKKRRAQ